jgi:hypothetical protein
MANKSPKKQAKPPKTTPEFEQAVKALGNTKPISNKDLVEWARKQKKNRK